jgi:hypothetical protein
LGCGESTDLTIDIPIERNAGSLTGYFDVSGYQETWAEIDVPYGNTTISTDALPVPPNELPSTPWRFEGLPAGSHVVKAKALIEGGNMIIEFPHKNEYNEKVRIHPLLETDINATFVSKPLKAQGQVTFWDQGGQTHLKDIQNGTFEFPNSSYVTTRHSYMLARGNSSVPVVFNAASGIGGKSLGRFIGAYDSSQNRAVMDYELLFNGLSPIEGPLDGSGARPTLWDVKQMIVGMSSDNEYNQYVIIDIGQDLPFLFDLSLEEEQPFQIPPQNICFGQIELTFRINEQLGSLYAPVLYCRQTGDFMSTTSNSSYYSRVYSNTGGAPFRFADRASEVTICAALPQGYQYSLTPRVRFVPQGGDESSVTYLILDPLIMPENNVLGCGDTGGPCLQFQDEEGNYTKLMISMIGEIESCLESGDLELHALVESDGVDVALVEYTLDNSPPVILCPSNCGPGGIFDIYLTSLQSGSHALKIRAVADNGCESKYTYTFEIQVEPLSLQCPADFTVHLNPGETHIARTDSRIAPHLNAIVVGGCDEDLVPSDNAPDIFETGETEVTFAIPGHTCMTTATVKPPIEHRIAFVEEMEGIDFVKLYSVEGGTLIAFGIVENPAWLESHNRGEHLGAAQRSASHNVKVFDSELNTQYQANIPGYRTENICFNPAENTHYAVLGRNNAGSYRIFLLREQHVISARPVPVFQHMSTPEIAWSNDGQKLTAITTVPLFNSQGVYINKYDIHIFEWDIGPTGFGSMSSHYERIESAQREEAHEILYVNDYLKQFTTTRGVWKSNNNQMVKMTTVDNVDMDICPDGSAAVFFQGHKIHLLLNPGHGTSQEILEGPEVRAGKTQVAISDDKTFVAFQEEDRVRIFSIPNFELVLEIMANQPQLILFAPIVDDD